MQSRRSNRATKPFALSSMEDVMGRTYGQKIQHLSERVDLQPGAFLPFSLGLAFNCFDACMAKAHRSTALAQSTKKQKKPTKQDKTTKGRNVVRGFSLLFPELCHYCVRLLRTCKTRSTQTIALTLLLLLGAPISLMHLNA